MLIFILSPLEYYGDNGPMIAGLGLLSFKDELAGIKNRNINPKYRTDQVEIIWINEIIEHNITLSENIKNKSVEADIEETLLDNKEANYRK